MRLWRKSEKTREGKYLVMRRDGTVPTWPSFVLGARDPAAPAALRAYAAAAEKMQRNVADGNSIYDPEYIEDIRDLADEFERYCKAHGNGDPSAPPHRKDDPATIEKMKEGQNT